MIVEYIRYQIPAEQLSEFEAAYKEAFIPLLASPYCLSAELSQCTESNDHYILRIEWTSTEDHLQKFRASEQFQTFLKSIQPYIPNIQEMRHYDVLISESKAKAAVV